MGVKRLMTYAKTHVQRQICLTPPPRSTTSTCIVFDALGGMDRYFNKGSFILDLQAMRDKVASDVQAFRRAGFELLVVLDGGVDPAKYHTWFKRRKEKLKHLHIVNNSLRGPARVYPPVDCWSPPADASHYLSQAFREAGCSVFISAQDADHEAAWLAIKRKAYGVLACDSDFLVFPGVERYMDCSTLDIRGNGSIYVGCVLKDDLVRYLSIAKDKLHGIAGILGNDVVSSWPKEKLQHLGQKWGTGCYVRAAAREVESRKKRNWDKSWKQADKYYVPVEPVGKNVLHPASAILLKSQVFIGGLMMEDLQAGQSLHRALAPLRNGVYARNGLDSIKEHLCIPSESIETWENGRVVNIDKIQPHAPEPPSNPQDLGLLVCQYLKAVDAISEFHFCALMMQLLQRGKHVNVLRDRYTYGRGVPLLKDIHASSLFLSSIEIVWMGATGEQPNCWEMFDGPLYHHICQTQVSPLCIVEPRISWEQPLFDWEELVDETSENK